MALKPVFAHISCVFSSLMASVKSVTGSSSQITTKEIMMCTSE